VLAELVAAPGESLSVADLIDRCELDDATVDTVIAGLADDGLLVLLGERVTVAD
jgi:hypothetical protein